jgi:Rrf2 family protein
MVHLVVVKAQRPLSSSRIAVSLDVSKDQLSKVLQRLVKEGLLTSRRGPKGGFSITVSPDQVTLLRIVEAIDGSLAARAAQNMVRSLSGGEQILRTLQRSLGEKVRNKLLETRLADLIQREANIPPARAEDHLSAPSGEEPTATHRFNGEKQP